MKIHVPDKWNKQAYELVDKALRDVGLKLHKEHGNSVPFPVFLHVCLCYSIDNIYKNAPSKKEAEDFIEHSINLFRKD